MSHYPRKISKEEINQLPLFKYQGEIKLIETIDEALAAAHELNKESLIGFDTETRPAFKKNESYQISLLQLATKNVAYLFRLNKIPLIPEVTEILANEKILKSGVAIRDDIIGLQNIKAFKPKSFIELADLAKEKQLKSFGLRSLTALLLGKRLSKSAKITNWEKEKLTQAQCAYAASDALVGLLLYEKLKTI